MTFQDLADNSIFWSAVRYLDEMKEGENIESLCEKLNLKEKDLYSVLTLLQSLGANYHIQMNSQKEAGHIKRVENSVVSNDIFSNFTMIEKIEMTLFYAVNIDTERASYIKNFYHKFLKSNEFMALSYFVDKADRSFAGIKSNVLSFKRNDDLLLKIERAIFMGHTLSILCKTQEHLKAKPYKLMRLDGELTIIAEDIMSAECIHIPLRQVSYVEEHSESSQSIISKLEFEDYIHSLRAIKETEIRLILKIDRSIEWEKAIDYEHFGNPCVIKKGKGHIIWAASVEPSEDIFEWIRNMGPGVEIIDPSAFKRIYLRYCEDRLLRAI